MDLDLFKHFNSLNKNTKLTFVRKSDENSARIEEVFKVNNFIMRSSRM